GFVQSVTMEGVTYHFDQVANAISTSGGVSAGVFDANTDVLTVNLSSGGNFTIDMDSGAYQYHLPTSLSASLVEHFDYTLVDKDGDTSASTVDISASRANVIIGTAGADTLLGTAGADLILGREGDDVIAGNAGRDSIYGGMGNDTLDGGAGNDLLSGGLGSDVFKWALADQGVVGLPAVDKIVDFDSSSPTLGGDSLDLRDLLVGENHAAGVGNLTNYLHFEKTGADTTIHVSSSGDYAAGFNVAKDVQTITLTGVDLVTGFANDQQVIQNLLTNNKLIVD
ncbi:MAG: type I secretion C-terminal target domain-containing protein, partial [Methylophilaceae bacterium]